MKRHLLYGQRVDSDRPLAMLERSEGDADVTLREGLFWTRPPTGDRVHAVEDFPRGPVLEIWPAPEGWFVAYAGWAARIEPTQIQYVATSATPEVRWVDVVERVLLPLWGLTHLPEVVALHGGAVAYGGQAWVVIGASGAGKSSTTRGLLERGARIISDDMVLIDVARGLALPSAPTLRLWEAPREGALESAPILGLRDKRWYRMKDEVGCEAPQEVGGIVVLAPTPGGPASGRLERVTGMRAMVAMLEQAFDLERPGETWARARMARVRRLAQTTPVWACRYGRSEDGVPRQIHAIASLSAAESLRGLP